jgi:hypothetical protein
MENLDGSVRNFIFYGKVHLLTPGSVSSLNTEFARTEDIHFNNNDFWQGPCERVIIRMQ